MAASHATRQSHATWQSHATRQAKRPPNSRNDQGFRGRFNSRGRTRTCDPLINSQLLYQLSYTGKVGFRTMNPSR